MDLDPSTQSETLFKENNIVEIKRLSDLHGFEIWNPNCLYIALLNRAFESFEFLIENITTFPENVSEYIIRMNVTKYLDKYEISSDDDVIFSYQYDNFELFKKCLNSENVKETFLFIQKDNNFYTESKYLDYIQKYFNVAKMLRKRLLFRTKH